MLRTILWAVTFGYAGNGATQQVGLRISKQGEIKPAIDKMLVTVPPEIQPAMKTALETVLPHILGETMQQNNQPVTYDIAGWYTFTQNGRKGVQVPGNLTLRIEGHFKNKRSAGTDDYYFIWDKNIDELKVVRIVPYGETYTQTKHLDELWRSLLKENSQRPNEHGSDIARRLGMDFVNGDIISIMTFDKY